VGARRVLRDGLDETLEMKMDSHPSTATVIALAASTAAFEDGTPLPRVQGDRVV
jgi:hypothetical protein